MLRILGVLLLAAAFPIQAGPPTEGLVGHWKLDEAEGEKAADSSGKGNAGTLRGGAKSSAEVPKDFIHAHSLGLDGKDGRVNAGDANVLAMKNALTITAWVRPAAESDTGGMIVNREGEYEIGRSPEGKLQFALANASPGWDFIDTGYALALKTWTHIAWTYSAADKKLAVYANGKEVFAQEGEGEIGDTYPDLNQLWIGGRQKEEGVEYFAGQIAEVRIYSRALKADEIGTVYAASFKTKR